MEQEVEFVKLQEKTRVVDDPNAFNLREDRPLVWLQRLCFAVLRRLGAFNRQEQVNIVRRAVQPSSVMQALFEQREELARMLNRKPEYVLIGAENYAEMMREVAVADYEFAFQAPYCTPDRRVMGLPIRVVPWMRGVLVVPPTE